MGCWSRTTRRSRAAKPARTNASYKQNFRRPAALIRPLPAPDLRPLCFGSPVLNTFRTASKPPSIDSIPGTHVLGRKELSHNGRHRHVSRRLAAHQASQLRYPGTRCHRRFRHRRCRRHPDHRPADLEEDGRPQGWRRLKIPRWRWWNDEIG
ncbi:hypothetical protein P171DRAFT_91801 [Karstenula rhodostoma CBS 690.94]|uniref:Uncharacterized protein n=1 Tax=Karstenula rhodostoma CBS 690.94 TaxID=1392251 RepID=A0A9P4U9L6_9PLEO|nr:hypothetical protein P171DRAFT_91801 [Karstenula rhodostoma CBS 690.94]